MIMAPSTATADAARDDTHNLDSILKTTTSTIMGSILKLIVSVCSKNHSKIRIGIPGPASEIYKSSLPRQSVSIVKRGIKRGRCRLTLIIPSCRPMPLTRPRYKSDHEQPHPRQGNK